MADRLSGSEAALQAEEEGVGCLQVALDCEQQRHIDVDPVRDQRGDRRDARSSRWHLDHQVGAIDQRPEAPRRGDRPAGLVGQPRIDLEADEAIASAGALVDRPEQVGDGLNVLDNEGLVDLLSAEPLSSEAGNLVVVDGGAGDRALKDRGVRRHPADPAARNHICQLP